VRLRHARPSDAEVLASFDVGSERSPWLDEVREIVSGLIAWRDARSAGALDRHVVILECDDGEIVGVCAHEAIVSDLGAAMPEHRYLMVTAIRADHYRQGLARILVESVVADLQSHGAQSVTWLVHPRNHASILFSRNVFPEADETSPPEDKPYVAFTLTLR
jgi:RimJ/RimL family protein N-acetyltransferase